MVEVGGGNCLLGILFVLFCSCDDEEVYNKFDVFVFMVLLSLIWWEKAASCLLVAHINKPCWSGSIGQRGGTFPSRIKLARSSFRFVSSGVLRGVSLLNVDARRDIGCS
jgi:hypothetical protein